MKHTNFPILLLILVSGIVLGAGGMYWFDTKGVSNTTVERLKEVGVAPTSDAIHYDNERYGFALDYPRGLVLKEFDEGKDSFTVVFQKPGELVGFQVYITPNVGDTIEGRTLQRDVSSGVVEDLKEEDLLIDGGKNKIRAATFWSDGPLTGKTREIWLLHGGYIFEFTAYAGADELLHGVLKTLTFDK